MTKYFTIKGPKETPRVFVKPPRGNAICIYVYDDSTKFGEVGHGWALKELKEMGAEEIDKSEADDILSRKKLTQD